MGEVQISANQARDLTDRIKVGVEAVWELVKQAYVSRVWDVLGYPSWDDYCTREFGTSRIRLPREERQEVVSSMREIGMSTRAIASATGTGIGTVHRELSRVPNGTPESEPAPVTGTDGKTYTQRPAPRPEPPSQVAPGEEIPTTTIIGKDDLDKLNAPAPTPGNDKPRAEAITSQFTSAIVDLNRIMAKFDRIANDPNFPRNKEKIAAMHRHDLNRSISELQDLADRINN